MSNGLKIAVLLTITCFFSCANDQFYKSSVACLDSLYRAVNLTRQQLYLKDSLQAYERLGKIRMFKQNLGAGLRDTISRSDAELLQRFVRESTQAQLFLHQRDELIRRAALITKQITDLKADASERRLGKKELSEHLSAEKAAAAEFIAAGNTALKLYKSATGFLDSNFLRMGLLSGASPSAACVLDKSH